MVLKKMRVDLKRLWKGKFKDFKQKRLDVFLIYFPIFFLFLLVILSVVNSEVRKKNIVIKQREFIEITQFKQNYTEDLANALKYLIQDVSIEDLKNKIYAFDYLGSHLFSKGFIQGSFWLGFKIRNQLNYPIHLVLFSSYPLLDKIEFYLIKNHKLLIYQKKGDRVFYSPFINNNLSYFELKLESYEDYEIFLKIQTESTTNVSLFIYSYEYFYYVNRIIGIIQGSFFGFLIFLLILEIMLIYYLSDKLFVRYLLFHLFFLLFNFSSSDLPILFFSKWYLISNQFTLISLSLMYLSILYLTSLFLNEIRMDLNLRKNLEKVLKLFYIIYIFHFFTGVLPTNSFLYYFRGISIVTIQIFIILVGFIFLYNKQNYENSYSIFFKFFFALFNNAD